MVSGTKNRTANFCRLVHSKKLGNTEYQDTKKGPVYPTEPFKVNLAIAS